VFLAYNFACAPTSATDWGYAYGLGTSGSPYDPYLTDRIGDVGGDGFARWTPDIYVDETSNLPVRFWGATQAQVAAPISFQVNAATLATQVQWLSPLDLMLTISGARVDGPKLAQSITFPAFSAVQGRTVHLAATATSGLAVSYVSSGLGCDASQPTAHGDHFDLTLETNIGDTCKVTASQAGNGSYRAASSVSRSVRLVGVPQTIVFSPGNSGYHVNDTLALTTGNVYAIDDNNTPTGMPITIATSGGCTKSSASLPSTITFNSATKCTVTASQAGGSGYAKAPNKVWATTPTP